MIKGRDDAIQQTDIRTQARNQGDRASQGDASCVAAGETAGRQVAGQREAAYKDHRMMSGRQRAARFS